MHGRCSGDAGEMQRRCRGDAAEVQGRRVLHQRLRLREALTHPGWRLRVVRLVTCHIGERGEGALGAHVGYTCVRAGGWAGSGRLHSQVKSSENYLAPRPPGSPAASASASRTRTCWRGRAPSP